MAFVLDDVRSLGRSGNYLLFPSISHFDPTRTSGLNLNLPDPETVYVPDLSESALSCLRPQWPVLISGHYRNSLVENKFHVL